MNLRQTTCYRLRKLVLKMQALYLSFSLDVWHVWNTSFEQSLKEYMIHLESHMPLAFDSYGFHMVLLRFLSIPIEETLSFQVPPLGHPRFLLFVLGEPMNPSPHEQNVSKCQRHPMINKESDTLPKTNIAPENGWLEYYLPIGKAYFQGLC